MTKRLFLSLFLSFIALVTYAQNSISNVSFSSPLEPGKEATITFDYTLEEAGWLRIVFGQTEDAETNNFNNWGDVYAINSWGSVKDLEAGTFTGVTATFTVPPTTTSSAAAEALEDAMKATVRLQADADNMLAEEWVLLNIQAAANTGKINSVTVPASAEIGATFTATINYSHDFSADQDVAVMLVSANVGGDADWVKTAGYQKLTLPAGTDVSKDIMFEVKTSEAVTTATLGEGKEWRFVVQFLSKDYKDKIIEITSPSTAINLIANPVLTIAGATKPYLGGDVDVTFDYQLKQSAVFEVSIAKYLSDGATMTTPEVIATNVVYSTETIAASTTPTNTESEKFTLKVKADAVPSKSLTNGEKYMLLVKILEGTSEENVYLTEFRFPVYIDQFQGLSITEKATFAVSPNPATDNVNFNTELTNVSVIDATGSVVETLESATSINTASYNAGMYIIKADQGTAKVVVE